MRDWMLKDMHGILQVACVMCKSNYLFSREQTRFSHKLQTFPLNQDGSIPMIYRKHLEPEQRQTLNQTLADNVEIIVGIKRTTESGLSKKIMTYLFIMICVMLGITS